jgi:hypothetical protein
MMAAQWRKQVGDRRMPGAELKGITAGSGGAAMQNAANVTAMLDISGSARLPGSSVEPDQGKWAGTVGGILVAGLAVTCVVAAVLAAMAFSQLTSVRADVAAAREELMLAQEHTIRLERQLEKAVQNFEQQQAKASDHKTSDQMQTAAGKENRADRPSFQLTSEETQLIRSYIKASPVTSDAAATISVGGELRDTTLLPLPSQIATKSARLAGGRFTIDRNGAIVISLRKSRQADAVIQPN